MLPLPPCSEPRADACVGHLYGCTAATATPLDPHPPPPPHSPRAPLTPLLLLAAECSSLRSSSSSRPILPIFGIFFEVIFPTWWNFVWGLLIWRNLEILGFLPLPARVRVELGFLVWFARLFCAYGLVRVSNSTFFFVRCGGLRSTCALQAGGGRSGGSCQFHCDVFAIFYRVSVRLDSHFVTDLPSFFLQDLMVA